MSVSRIKPFKYITVLVAFSVPLPVQRCRTVSRRSAPALVGKDGPAESACNEHSKNIPQLRASAAHHMSSGLDQCLQERETIHEIIGFR